MAVIAAVASVISICSAAPAGAATYDLDTASTQFAVTHYASVPSLSVWQGSIHTLYGVSSAAARAIPASTDRATLIRTIENDSNYLNSWELMVTGYNPRVATDSSLLTTAIDDTQRALEALPNGEWGDFKEVMDGLEYREFAFSGNLYFTRRLQATTCSTCGRIIALGMIGSVTTLAYNLLVNGHNPAALNGVYAGLGASFLVAVLNALWELHTTNVAGVANAQTTGVLQTYARLLNALVRSAVTMYDNFVARLGGHDAAIRELRAEVGRLTNRVRDLEAGVAQGPPVVRTVPLGN